MSILLPPPSEILPHKPPFLFLDRCLTCTEEGAIAEKYFGPEEPFFQGHFPDWPLVPGVILIESMAQTLAYWAAFTRPDLRLLLAGVEDCKFRRSVQPGQTVRFSVQLERVVLSKAVVGVGTAHVGALKVAKARLTGFALPKDRAPDSQHIA